jgi:hypothetical protein
MTSYCCGLQTRRSFCLGGVCDISAEPGADIHELAAEHSLRPSR